ncbi:hypothetical protein F946_01798 [Acinetobacter johnsonii ANC 3681]|uniref:Uncharacterized protein n=1 Tax=Acinetobacter johnsonii ANC 3681 TaxID=1217662 RepID=N9CVK5_ACIJO|nr:hypothetical protein [Acinetobacter johnsonii]ENV72323.1 hypothetical protein F946_01798 [Acinetobacter johnsonii ANC 3681]
MITPFIFDKEIFNCTKFKENLLVSDSLIEDWERFGILLFPSTAQILELTKKIQQDFPIKYQKRWTTALTYFPKYIINKDIVSDFSLSNNDLPRLLEVFEHAETILVSSENYQLIKENLDISEIDEGCELLDYQFIKRSKNFELSKIHSIKQIDYRENNQQVFKRLKNIFKYTKELTIVDRYLFKNDFSSAYDPAIGTTALKKIFKYLSDQNLHITNFLIVSSNKDVTQENITQLLKDILSTNSKFYECFSELKIIMRDDRQFSNIFHDRILRTTYHYLEFGAGMVDALGPSSTERFMTFNCKSRTQVDYQKYFNDISLNQMQRNECSFVISKENPL